MFSIFPERVLDSSIHTALLVGIVVTWLATETLGWVFAGFVVSGYVAALAIAHPLSAVATILETVLTYGAVWGIAIGARRLGLWQRAFGRERFLLFLIASVPVRLLVEGLAAPHVEGLLRPLVDSPQWVSGQFFSIGIILVPLWANAFWKVGLSRGLLQTGTTTGITYLALQYVLIPLTNFKLGRFELTFENLALDFLAMPKVYIVLLITAVVATRNTRKYGWDFNGILVPSLLAIILFTPEKAGVTLAEAVLLVWVYRGLLRIPAIGRLNLEGPRRLVSMYALAYMLKWIIAWCSVRWFPGVFVSDLFGFGYLLTSLIAVKCVEQRDAPKIIVRLGFTAVQGFVLGIGVSMALTLLVPTLDDKSVRAPSSTDTETAQRLDTSVTLGRASIRRSAVPIREAVGGRMVEALAAFRLLGSEPTASEKTKAAGAWRDLGLDVRWVRRADGRRCLSASDARFDAREPDGIPLFWWCGGDTPALLVTRPLADSASLWIGGWLMHYGDFSSLIVLGTDDEWGGLSRSALEIRAQKVHGTLVRDALGKKSVVLVATTPANASSLDTKAQAAGVIATGFRDLLPGLRLAFTRDHGALQELWSELDPRDAILSVSLADVDRQLVQKGFGAQPLDGAGSLVALVSGNDAPAHEADEADEADEGHDRRQRTQRQRETVESDPLLSLAERVAFAELLVGEGLARAAASDASSVAPASYRYVADQLGFRVRSMASAAGTPVWVLDEPVSASDADGSSRREWGTWVFRPGAAILPTEPQGQDHKGRSTNNQSVVVAAPLAVEEKGTAQVAAKIFEDLRADGLWLAGAASRANGNHEGGVPGRLGPELPVEQLALWESLRPDVDDDEWRRRLVVVREQRQSDSTLEDVIVASAEETFLQSDQRRVLDALAPALDSWTSVGFEDGRVETASTVPSSFFGVRYLHALEHGRATALWFSPRVLREVRGAPAREQRVEQYRSLGLHIWTPEEADVVLARVSAANPVHKKRVVELMSFHANHGAQAPLQRLLDDPDVEVALVVSDVRTEFLAWGSDWLCRVGAAAAVTRAPDSCWQLAKKGGEG